MDEGQRLVRVERRTDALDSRLALIERTLRLGDPAADTREVVQEAAAATASPTATAGPRVAPQRPPRTPSPRRPEAVVPTAAPSPQGRPAPAGQSFEDLVGGRLLAWVGGAAMVLGIVFLFAMAVSNGWVGEGARTAMGGAASAALLALGARLHPRKGRTEAALAAASAGIAGLFVTFTVAAQVYGLIPAPVAVAGTLGVGGIATALAVVWRAQLIAALGIVGALLSPVLAGTSLEGAEVWVLWAAFLSAAGVLAWQRWDWLALVAFLVATPQWLVWLSGVEEPATALVGLVAFGLVGAAAAIGFEVRSASGGLSRTSAALIASNALVLAAAGWFCFSGLDEPLLARGWLVALALTHLLAGALGRRSPRVSSELTLLSLVLGVLLADLAFEASVDGPAVALGFAATVAVFAGLRRMVAPGSDAFVLEGGIGLHLCLALAHTLITDAPPAMLTGGEGELAPAGLVLAGLAAACLVSARTLQSAAPDWQLMLNGLAVASVAYLAAVTLDGATLVAVWSLEAVVMAAIWRRTADVVAAWGALANLGLALAHLVTFEVTPDALVFGLEDPVAAALAGAAGAVAAAALAWTSPAGDPSRPWLAGAAAVAALYVVSALVVTPFQPGDAGVVDGDWLALDVRQEGQMLLSALWALVGSGALVVGLRADLRLLRVGALALLLTSVGKVFVFDLAALDSIYRVVSFIGLGLLLLASAFVWQRIRPRPPEDLREVPEGLR